MYEKTRTKSNNPFQKSCYICKGIALYSRAMNSAGKKPYCIGKETELTNPWEIENLKDKVYNEKMCAKTTSKSTSNIRINNERNVQHANYNDILQCNWLNAFHFISQRNVQWNYLHLPSSNLSGTPSRALKKRKDVYISPLQYLFLRPPDKRTFVVYCFGKTIYEETFDNKTNLVPNVVKGFYHIQWKRNNSNSINIESVTVAPTVQPRSTHTESSNESLELWAGDFWIAAPSNTRQTSTTISSMENKHRHTSATSPIRSSMVQKYLIRPQQHQVRDISRRQHLNPFMNGLMQYRILCDTIGLKAVQHTRNALNAWHNRRSRR